MIGVTGGTGFIGKRLVAALARDSSVRVLALNMHAVQVPNTEYVFGELTSPEVVDRFIRGCTSIIHMAGIAHTDLQTEAARERAYAVNVEGTRIVLEAAMRNEVQRFVFVSTAHVYAMQTGRELDESSHIGPTSFYSMTKIEAEKLVHKASENGMKTVIARPCLIYGPGARFNLERMVRALDVGYYFHISGVEPVRSFLSVENAALALQHLVNSRAVNGVYNLADESSYSLVDFANELADRMKRPRPHTLPVTVVRAAAAIGSAAQRMGLRMPLSNETVEKLTSDFTLNTRRLAQTGFKWDHNSGALRQEMVDHYFRTKPAHWFNR